MKHVFPVLLALIAVMGIAAPPAAAETGSAFIKIGAYEVYPLLDRTGSMKAELFSGPLSPEERLAFMPGGEAPSSINVFLVKGPKGNYLIDGGLEANSGGRGLGAMLAGTGLGAGEINLVFLTHLHPDHIGGLLENATGPALPKARLWVNQAETDHWLKSFEAATSDEIQARLLRAYDRRVMLFQPGQELIAGLRPVAAYGHTPGHSALRLQSGDDELLFVGDLIHAAALQFPAPGECAGYDLDKDGAAAARRTVLELAADQNLIIAGAHIPYPGLGRVSREGSGFTFTPLTADSAPWVLR